MKKLLALVLFIAYCSIHAMRDSTQNNKLTEKTTSTIPTNSSKGRGIITPRYNENIWQIFSERKQAWERSFGPMNQD